MKIKLTFGPGPAWAAEATSLLVRSGPAGVVVLTIGGTVAGTVAVTAFVAYTVEAAKAKGLSHKRKVLGE